MSKYTRLRVMSVDWATTYLDFDLYNPDLNSKYILRSADGLGPPEINVNYHQHPVEGGHFGGFRPADREIILQITINPNYSLNQSPEELRRDLHALLPNNGTFVVGLSRSSGGTISVQCMLKRMESVPFSKEPVIQLTIMANSPYFSSVEQVVSDTSSPVGNRSIEVNNIGDADVGFRVTFNMGTSPGSSLVIGTSSGVMTLSGAAIVPSTQFILNSNPGERGFYQVSNGFNLLRYRTLTSVWPVLKPGVNTVYLIGNISGQTDVRFSPKFWGI